MRSTTRPITTLRSAKARSTSSQIFIFSAFSRESTTWPSRSSVRSSRTSTMSPDWTVTCPCSSRNSSTGIMPSDLKPTSTTTADDVTRKDRTLHDLTFRNAAEAGIVGLQKTLEFLRLGIVVFGMASNAAAARVAAVAVARDRLPARHRSSQVLPGSPCVAGPPRRSIAGSQRRRAGMNAIADGDKRLKVQQVRRSCQGSGGIPWPSASFPAARRNAASRPRGHRPRARRDRKLEGRPSPPPRRRVVNLPAARLKSRHARRQAHRLAPERRPGPRQPSIRRARRPPRPHAP